MNESELRAVMRLLLAIDAYRQPVRFKVGLPPAYGELADRQTEAAQTHAERAAALDDAMAKVRALVIDD